jgi:hypothetical protein
MPDPKLKLVGWAFTCLTVSEKPEAEIFSWVKRDDADRNHAAVRNDVKTFSNVSKIFPVYRKE